MRRLLLVFIFASSAAMAQHSGPYVTMPTHRGTSSTIHHMAHLGAATVFVAPEYRLRHSHEIGKSQVHAHAQAQAQILGKATESLFSALPSTPYKQTANFQPMGAPISVNFEAQGVGTPSFVIAGAPPDTTLGVSDTQIVQWVNTQIAVYDKAGNPLLPGTGFINGNAIWAALGATSLCATTNRGDPLVQYDRMADRWILSQFAFNAAFSNNSQCIAVSQTSNALGAYNLYEYNFGTQLPDFGKLGVWPDAYYITYNMFNNGANFSGGRACAYDRTQMLSGLPASQICFNSTSRFSYLPADLDGGALPPVGMPNPHISWNWAFLAVPPYTMQLTKFHVDFGTPANSTFDDGFGGSPFSFVGFPLGSTTLAACNDSGGTCIPQLGTANALDTLGSRHMYRLVYRNFGTFDALLFTQTVDDNVAVSTGNLRWWEIRNIEDNPPVVYQNSTYMPDTTARWMGSAAFDKLGNIAIGYSASSASINPGIRIAGRRRTDPKNLLRTEQVVQAGTGSQTGTLHRWGDYSTMQIDPTDDCTFWYTTQYIGANGTFNWRTRIASFKFTNCTP